MLQENIDNTGGSGIHSSIENLDESASFGVDKAVNYQAIDFISDDDDDKQFELFNNIKNLDKARKLQQKDKATAALDVDAKLVDKWVANVDKLVYLADICERDGSLNPDTVDNILINVFKTKQLIEYVRLHPDHVVKYGVAGISVPFSSLYSNINEAIELVKAGIASDKRAQTAISALFIENSSIMTTTNSTGLKISDIVSFNDEEAEIDDTFDLAKQMVSGSEPIAITDMLDVVDVAGSMFVIEKASLIVDSEALVISDDFKRTGAFKDMCAILASMMIIFIDDGDVDFNLLDRML